MPLRYEEPDILISLSLKVDEEIKIYYPVKPEEYHNKRMKRAILSHLLSGLLPEDKFNNIILSVVTSSDNMKLVILSISFNSSLVEFLDSSEQLLNSFRDSEGKIIPLWSAEKHITSKCVGVKITES
ncbi:TPA: hypothetical protein ACGO6K_001721 [Streptococcus suis]